MDKLEAVALLVPQDRRELLDQLDLLVPQAAQDLPVLRVRLEAQVPLVHRVQQEPLVQLVAQAQPD